MIPVSAAITLLSDGGGPINISAWDFPGGSVVKTPPFLIPGWGTKIPHAMWCGQKVKKKKQKYQPLLRTFLKTYCKIVASFPEFFTPRKL